jgi:hypothetical protein
MRVSFDPDSKVNDESDYTRKQNPLQEMQLRREDKLILMKNNPRIIEFPFQIGSDFNSNAIN